MTNPCKLLNQYLQEMQKPINFISYRFLSIISLFILVSVLSSCSSVFDDTSECYSGFHIRFKYDYNMKYADAFSNEVKNLTVFIFDQNGILQAVQTESGDTLKSNKYFMELDVPEGTYDMVVWAGLLDKSFSVSQLTLGESKISDLIVSLNKTGSRSDSNLSPLWHGQINDVIVGNKYEDLTVSLVKDTKQIRIKLQQINGLPITDEDFEYEITDYDNFLSYDNNPRRSGELIYFPYVTGFNTTVEPSTETNVYAEFSTSRLMTDSKTRLRITRKKDNTLIMDIPLIDYLLLGALESYRDQMSSQEYLDRQDVYSIIFFLDENLTWLKIQIIINGWTIRFNNENY